MKKHRHKGKLGTRVAPQAGISLTEAVLGVAVMGAGLAGIATLQKDNIDRINNQVAAHQMATIRTAAERYVRDNYGAVLAMVPATGDTATIPDSDLQDWLPDSMFSGTEIAASPYGGDYVINVRNVGPGASGQPRVEMTVVTTGGKPIPESALPQVAADLGANGGFRPVTNSLYNSNTVQGAYGGWQMAVADLATAPAPGSLVGFAYFGDGAVLSDFLYRNPVPGQPQAQRMNANIDSNNFGLANVAQIGGNIDTANPANAPVAPPANTVRFGGVTAGTNGFARGDVSLEANNINVANLSAQGDVAVFDANNIERGRMSGATRALTLGAAPGGATTVVADGTGQTVTVRDGVRDRTQLTGTGQVRGFDAAGTETVRADAVAQNIRVGNVAGNRTEMTGGGLFSAYDNANVLRARISGNDGSLRLSNNTGEKITADASTQRLAMRNAGNNEIVVADGAGQTVTVRDGVNNRTQMTGTGLFSAFDNTGALRAQLDGQNARVGLYGALQNSQISHDDATGMRIATTSAGGVRVADNAGDRALFDDGQLQVAGFSNVEGGQITLSPGATPQSEGANTWSMDVRNNNYRVFYGSSTTANDQEAITIAPSPNIALDPPTVRVGYPEGWASFAGPRPALVARRGIEINQDDNDSMLRFHDPNNRWFTMGVDQSDGGRFKINYGDTPGNNSDPLTAPGAVTGARNDFVIDSGGNVSFGRSITMGTDIAAATDTKLTIANANGPGGSNIFFGVPGLADMGYDGGTDDNMVFAHTKNTGFTLFQRGDGQNIMTLENATRRARFEGGGMDIDGGVNTAMFLRNNQSPTGSQIWMLGGPANGDFQYDGGTADDSFRFGHTKTTGNTIFNRGDGQIVMQLDNSTRNVTIGGDAYANAFYYTSDGTLKKDIKPIEDSLSKIARLQGVSWNWKSDDRQDIGLIAQNVQTVFPELVSKREDGKLTVKYGNMVGPLIEAVKELNIKTENLQKSAVAAQDQNQKLSEKTAVLEVVNYWLSLEVKRAQKQKLTEQENAWRNKVIELVRAWQEKQLKQAKAG